MDRLNKRLFIFAVLNLLLLAGGIGVGAYAYVAAGRYFAHGIIYIAPRLNESRLHWSMEDVAAAERRFTDFTFSGESRGSVLMASSTHQVVSTVFYVEGSYFGMHFMEFIEGNRWQEDANALVINEALAWRLFGGGDIAGLHVEIGGRPYVVAGVVRQGRGGGGYMAWMPRAASPVPLPVTALYLHAHNYNLVDAAVVPAEILRAQFRTAAEYAVVDINRFVEGMGVRYRLLVYAVLIYVIILLTRAALRHMSMKSVLPAAGALVCLAALLTGINEILYWLPNLADPETSVTGSITGMGILPPDGYLSFGLRRLSELNRMGNAAWLAGAVGFVCFSVLLFVMED